MVNIVNILYIVQFNAHISDFFQQSVTLHTDLGNLKVEVFCDQCPKAAEVKKSTVQVMLVLYLQFFFMLV